MQNPTILSSIHTNQHRVEVDQVILIEGGRLLAVNILATLSAFGVIFGEDKNPLQHS